MACIQSVADGTGGQKRARNARTAENITIQPGVHYSRRAISYDKTVSCVNDRIHFGSHTDRRIETYIPFTDYPEYFLKGRALT